MKPQKFKKMPPLAEIKAAATIEREFVDVAGAATWGYLSEAHIRRMLTDGKLTRYKLGARTLIKFSELRALVQPVLSK